MKTRYRKHNGLIIAAILGMIQAVSTAATYYVSLAGAHVYPYADWASAATNIQDAVDATVDGDTVLIGSGHYLLNTQVVVRSGIILESSSGPEATIIDGQGTSGCLTVERRDCIISGLTITNSQDTGIDRATLITNCVVIGNAGRGIYRGTAVDCRIEANGNTTIDGGGLMQVQAINCIIRGNVARAGGGMSNGTAKDCLIENNVAASNGGGVHASKIVDNCVISRNTAYAAGGAIDSTLNDCVISSNTATAVVGGVAGCTATRCIIAFNHSDGDVGGMVLFFDDAYDCLIIGNSAAARIGGVAGGTLWNCTVAGNFSGDEEGGGIWRAAAYNSIIWNNIGGNLTDSECFSSCSPNLIQGVDGNITNAPLFLDPVNDDYRLLATSPCIDAGSNDFVSVDMDLDQMPRIMDGDFDGVSVVDMGAYELQAVIVPAGNIALPPINLKSRGRTPVKILSTEFLDITSMDLATIRLAGAAAVHHKLNDFNGDGHDDLKLMFNTAELDVGSSDTEAMLIGQTDSGTFVVGMVPLRLVPSKKK